MAQDYSGNLDFAVLAEETVIGTAVTLDDADFDVNLREISATVTIEVDDESAKNATGDHGMAIAVSGAQSVNMKFSHRLAWSGSFATAPSIDKLLYATGHKKVEYKRAITSGAASGQKIVAVSTSGSPFVFVQGQIVTIKEGALTENCVIQTVGSNQLTMVDNLTNSYTTSGFVHTGIGYQPLVEADEQTVTIAAYSKQRGTATPGAKAISAAGAMGTVEIGADGIGKPIMTAFDMTGKYEGYDTVANADIPVYSAACGEVIDTNISTTVSVGGTSKRVSSWSLNIGNTIDPVIDQSEASGYAYYAITKREPVFSCNPIRTSSEDPFGNVIANTTGELIVSHAHWQIRMPKAQWMNPSIASREGLVSWDQNFRGLRNCDTDSALADEAAYEIIMGRRS